LSRFLVVAPNWIGDALMAQPLLARLKGEIDVVAPEWVAPVMRRMPEVRSVISTPFVHGPLQLRERWKLGRRIKGQYDQAYVLPNSWKSALIPWHARIARRTGYIGEFRYGLLNDARKATGASMAAHYAALAGYVVAQAIIFVPLLYVANYYAPGAIASAAAVTFVGFVGLSLIAFITRKDFSFLRGILCWGGVLALVLIVAGVIFGFQLGTFFSVAMVGLAGAAILYDTSNILHHYPEDRYVAAALELFASVALMLWYVLRIFTSRR